MSLLQWFGDKVFSLVHQNNLVYNTCWEDPRLDRIALELGPDDNVLVITSAGCNALDYALDAPGHVYAVDMNARQNALLDLKQAGIRRLEFDDFFRMFGLGRLPRAEKIYRDVLREELAESSRNYWDDSIGFFDDPWGRTFYFHGTSGSFAKLMNIYIDNVVRLRRPVNDLLDAATIEEQREIYKSRIERQLWTDVIRFAMSRDFTLSLLGVPPAQREHLEKQYRGGMLQFIEDSLHAVFAELPLHDNYFWRVYLTGEYTPTCCPSYLSEEGFAQLRAGLVDRVSTHTNSVEGFLKEHDGPISRLILLDHMDWMAGERFHLLESEWQAILERAAPQTRIIWRSGGLRTDFVDDAQVQWQGNARRLGELLRYHPELAARLHPVDRVHTYGSFHIADLAA